MSIADIDCLAYYEDPRKKLARQLWSGMLGNTPDLLHRLQGGKVETSIRESLGYEGPVKFIDHHRLAINQFGWIWYCGSRPIKAREKK